MDSGIKFLTTVYISFSVAQNDVTHHPAYQPELLSSRTVCAGTSGLILGLEHDPYVYYMQ
jgi:hypothetical protein